MRLASRIASTAAVSAPVLPSGLSRRAFGGLILTAWSGFASAATFPELTLPELGEGKKRLYLVRHGETDWNVAHRVQGRTDNSLNAQGRRQAESLSAYLERIPLDVIATSPLKRASTTAEAVAARHPGATRVTDARFVEMSFGSREGAVLRRGGAAHGPLGDINSFQPEYEATLQRWADGQTDAAWPGGESVDDVAERGTAGLRALGLFSPEAPARHILVLAHGRFNKIVLAELTSERRRSSTIEQGNTCVNVVDIDPATGSCVVRVLNAREHLEGLREPSPVP